MPEVIPFSLDSPAQLILSLSGGDYEEVASMAVVGMEKDGAMYVSHNKMTAERMLYLARALESYAMEI